MDPSGYVNSTGALGQKRINEMPDPAAFAPIYPEPDLPDVGSDVNAPLLQYVTPDAMFVYCQTRLRGVDTQCRDIMAKQEKNAKVQTALGELQSAIAKKPEGYKESNPEAHRIIGAAFDRAIEAAGPNSELGQKLIAIRDNEFNAGNGDSVVNPEEMKSIENGVKTQQAALNSQSELDMIHLQSLMSQRQTAIQLTTNILQSLNDSTNKIVANIGR
jgi:hypothetical protein